jgi:hypothetical protein
VSSAGKHVFVYDVQTKQCVVKHKHLHEMPATTLSWAKDDTMLISGSADRSIFPLSAVSGGGGRGGVCSCVCSMLLLVVHLLVAALILGMLAAYHTH